MQLKFNKQKSLGQSWAKKLVKFLFLLILLAFAIFVLEKVDFPYPKQNFKIDITNEIIKLK
jgi:uncharacterized integral membrane protein|tara:strand:+ start:40 stop:222 length:183 start_codon:yes stop_codon:yes gene_type:complete